MEDFREVNNGKKNESKPANGSVFSCWLENLVSFTVSKK